MAVQQGAALFAGVGTSTARATLIASESARYGNNASFVVNEYIYPAPGGNFNGNGTMAAYASQRQQAQARFNGLGVMSFPRTFQTAAFFNGSGSFSVNEVISAASAQFNGTGGFFASAGIPTVPEVIPGDRHVRRSGDDYAWSLLSLLPHGQAWPRDPGTVMVRVIYGLAQEWGFFDSRAGDLLERESDPRSTLELLPDWERNWGLPDPCFAGLPQTIGDRQRLLVLKMTLLGGQSRDFFIQAAARLGYTITIHEFAPFMAGVSRVGDTRKPPLDPNPLVGEYRWYIGPKEMRFYWTVNVGTGKLTWFRASKGQAGVDPHLRIGKALDLECLINRWKPAHTQVIFDYSGLGWGDNPMAGTP